MTPIYHSSLGSSSASPFPAKFNEDQTVHQFLTPSSQVASSSINSSLSYHVFFNSNTHDPSGYFHREQQQQQQDQGDNIGGLQAYDGDRSHVENKSTNNNGLKFSLWKKDVIADDQNDQVKWMSSKMRLMLKMKKPDDHPTDAINPPSTCATNNILLAPTEAKAIEQDHNSTINSSNNIHNNSNPIIRVCSDCNTTKTPLWRSGPRGPKSLCNACGIRQRKARRAAAAAAAAAAESGLTTPANQATMPMKSTKFQNKDHKKQNMISGHVTKYKKKQYCKTIAAAPMVATPASSGVVASPERNNCFEDFLVSLSKNLAFHRVFPQDEKEAAILLMAISCGYIHG